MKPGRELDRLVAEKVMGTPQLFRIKQETLVHLSMLIFTEDTSFTIGPEHFELKPVPRYSSDWNEVCKVVKKLGDRLLLNTVELTPHAICLAALKAVGASPEDPPQER
jgi:hypothetical protein